MSLGGHDGASLVVPVAEMGLLEVVVGALHVHQLTMCALLYDTALVDVADDVSTDDGRQAVGDDDGRTAGLSFVQRLLYVLYTQGQQG